MFGMPFRTPITIALGIVVAVWFVGTAFAASGSSAFDDSTHKEEILAFAAKASARISVTA